MDIVKPDVDYPEGAPPKVLEITDIWEGDGKVAAAGSNVKVHYVGVAYSTGEEFDASWNRGEPLEFRLGAGLVIQGWDQGVQGMRVGGRRKLVIPPDLGYGSRGAPGAIKPNETLIFVCDLIAALAGRWQKPELPPGMGVGMGVGRRSGPRSSLQGSTDGTGLRCVLDAA